MQKDDEEFIALETWLFRHQVLLSWGEEVAECLFFQPFGLECVEGAG